MEIPIGWARSWGPESKTYEDPQVGFNNVSELKTCSPSWVLGDHYSSWQFDFNLMEALSLRDPAKPYLAVWPTETRKL